MKKELPISITPSITSYAYYALPLSIIEAEDKIGQIVATFDIIGAKENDWHEIGDWGCEGNRWFVTDNSAYGQECNACLYRSISGEDDYVHILVNSQRYSGPWGAINLFLTDDKENVLLGDNEYLCRFGSFVYDGIHMYARGKEKKIKEPDIGRGTFELVLHKSGQFVEVYAGQKALKMLGRTELPMSGDKELYIGIQVKHENNTFYPWFYSNFIALSCDVNCTHRRLDYLTLSKHWEFYAAEYFLDINSFRAEEILDLGGVKYIKKCINRQKYCELKIDQYYLKGREEYGEEHHLHQNLIYGYDDRQKCFLLIGYQNDGKIAKFLLSYKNFEKSIRHYAEENVKTLHYAEDGHSYLFQPLYVRKMLQEYLNSLNSSISTEFILPQDDRKYGLAIYDGLMSEQGIKVLLSDRRVSYLLWEHKYHMKGRIDYLTAQGIFSKEERESLQKDMTEILDITFNLRNMIQKYQMRPEKTDTELLKKWLSDIKKKEQHLLEKLLKLWRVKNAE